MERQKGMQTAQSKKLNTDWWYNVNFGAQYAEYSQEVLYTPVDFQELCDRRLGCIYIAKQQIKLTATDVHAINSALYHTGPNVSGFENPEIAEMICTNVLEPTQSEWALIVILALKKDGSLRLCIEYRKLNALTGKEAYQIPRTGECLKSLGRARIFSSLEANSGY